MPYMQHLLPQERENSAMRVYNGWEGAGGTCHTCSIFQKRGETVPCEITLVGRGQEEEEGRFYIIVATIILSELSILNIVNQFHR